MSWQNSLFLNDSEEIIESWTGDYEQVLESVVPEEGFLKTNYTTVEAKKRVNGVLVLTNQRLVWLEKRGFFVFASYHTSFEIDLSTLKGISCGGIFDVWISITDKNDERRFHLQGVGKNNIDDFRNLVFDQAKKLKKSAKLEKSKPQKVIVKEIVMLPCQYCRSLMPQTALFCPHCGARRTG